MKDDNVAIHEKEIYAGTSCHVLESYHQWSLHEYIQWKA